MMFLSPGKHAEPGGDVATIIARAVAASGSLLDVAVTPLLAEDAGGGLDALCELLAQRLRAAVR